MINKVELSDNEITQVRIAIIERREMLKKLAESLVELKFDANARVIQSMLDTVNALYEKMNIL